MTQGEGQWERGRGEEGGCWWCKSQKSNAVYFLRLAEKSQCFGLQSRHLPSASSENAAPHVHPGVISAIVCNHPINLMIGSKPCFC